jgi:hypothetical protein
MKQFQEKLAELRHRLHLKSDHRYVLDELLDVVELLGELEQRVQESEWAREREDTIRRERNE